MYSEYRALDTKILFLTLNSMNTDEKTQNAQNFKKNFNIGVKMGMEDAKKENENKAKELKEKEAKK